MTRISVSRTSVTEPPDARPAADAPYASALSWELVRLSRTTQAIRIALATHDEDGVEWSTYVLLFQLVRRGPQRSSALAGNVCVDPSTISRQVAQLVKLGLVERRADPDDGRATLLVATTEGERVHAGVKFRRERAIARLVEHWAPDDVDTLTTLLLRLNDDFDTNRTMVVDAITQTGEPS